ncbi:MAG: hypothetical protein M1812_002757 [Candelaria pacifica]|nr:MAG: hypothetical protein M1812_002757 [Candelaria pacifica]
MQPLRSSAKRCLISRSQFVRRPVSSPSRAANYISTTQALRAPRPLQTYTPLNPSSQTSPIDASIPSAPRRPADAIPKSRAEAGPAYEVTFTCKPCTHRSKHRMSKQAYHKGTVLITCPDCKNRHVMSDHLGIFSDQSMTIEDLMRKNGELVKRGTIGTDGDVEFWDDESTTESAALEAKQEEQS